MTAEGGGRRQQLPGACETIRLPPTGTRVDGREVPSLGVPCWQVWRIEIHTGTLRPVLIAERPTEQEAITIALAQIHRCVVVHGDDEREPYVTRRAVRVVTDAR
jgi:hypothetical protein